MTYQCCREPTVFARRHAMYLPQPQGDLKGAALLSHPRDDGPVKLFTCPPTSPPSAHVTTSSVTTEKGVVADAGLRVRLSSSKPGVIERIGSPSGSPSRSPLPENSSESSSSICQASDDSGGSCTSGDTEAQSAYRGPLTGMAALDESLPIKRPGLSKFFGGKSRSFASLADVSSVSDLAKPNNAYAYIKRRKMGFSCPLDRHRSYPPPARSSGATIAKKLPTSGSRSSLAVAVILEGLTDEQQQQELQQHHPPVEPRTFPSRSFSLTDLHRGDDAPSLRRAFVRS